MDTNKTPDEQLITFKLKKDLLKDFKIALLRNNMTMKEFFNGMVESLIKLDKQKLEELKEKK